ncbi:MAG: 50S ribosomal protein L5 [Patescibacteria group bacterium]
MNRLKKKYQDKILPELKKLLGHTNDLAIPKLEKIVINMGISDPQEPRQRKQALDNIAKQFELISGQKPKMTLAKKSIAAFKLREGDPLGIMVTLRSDYMWEFLDKLISVVLPRVKDFRGTSRTSFDGRGNYNLGIEEQIVFPEINYDQIERVRGLQVTLVTSTTKNDQAFKLLELLGMPFKKKVKT